MPQQKPCFFKVMIDDFKQKLEIPEAFLKNMNEKSSEIAILENPSGIQWRVQVQRTIDGRLYMEDGWGCFASANSLSLGEFALFRYMGHMNFSVDIYGTDTLEREDAVTVTYPHEVPKRRGRPPKVREGFQFQAAKRPGRPPKIQQGAQLQGSKRRGRPPKSWNTQKHYGPIKNILKPPELAMFFQNAEITHQDCVSEPRMRHGDEAIFRRPEEAALVFTSDFPYFVVKLKAYTLNFPYQLGIPITFARDNFPGNNINITMRNLAGKIWTVRVYKTGQGAYRFTSGWEKFAFDNSLMEGDCCVFELVAKSKIQVHIFPAHDRN